MFDTICRFCGEKVSIPEDEDSIEGNVHLECEMDEEELTRLIIEAQSGHNDGYTREYYMAQLRDIYKQLKQLDFLN